MKNQNKISHRLIDMSNDELKFTNEEDQEPLFHERTL